MTGDLGGRKAVDVQVATARKRAAEIIESLEHDFRARWQALAGLGALADAAGEDLSDRPVTAAVATIEGLGQAGLPPGLCYALTSQRFGIQAPLRQLLNEDNRSWLEGVAQGERILCHALTEERGGSDPLGMSTRAEPDPAGGWRLRGGKSFVTAAPVADVGLVFARTDEGSHPFAISAFLVDLHAPGVCRSPAFDKTALTDVPMGGLTFDRVRLTPEQLVGEQGAGLAVLATTTTWERALLLSYALGPMRRVLDRTVAWARSRDHFGRPMGASHLVAARVSQMALALLRCRQLSYTMAGRFDDGERPGQLATDAALVKISLAEDYRAFTQQATLLGGARSFVTGTGMTADLADPAAASVYAGHDDLLRVTVARGLGLPVEN